MEAIGERMKPMVEFISQEMERLVLTNDQLAQKRGADYGEDYFKSGQKADVSLFISIVFCRIKLKTYSHISSQYPLQIYLLTGKTWFGNRWQHHE